MSKPVRIAYLTAIYPGVSHTFILREVEGLRALGLDVETVSVRRPGPEHLRGPAERAAAETTYYLLETARRGLNLPVALVAALARPGLFFRALGLAWNTRAPGLGAGLYQLFYLAEALVLARHLRARGVTHLHSHFAQASATVAMLTAELAEIAFSFTLHGPADLYEPHRWRLGDKIARAGFVSCISHFARAQGMLFSDPAHWPRLRIVHCGVVPETYAQAPDTPRDGADGLHLLFVGRLAPVKGLRVLLDALAAARETHPGLRLTIVGDGEDRAHLEALAAPMGEAVRFTGYLSQDEVAEVLAQADAFVLPSFAEGLPVVLMEALAAGKPAIAPRVAGVAELIEDGRTGYLVHAGDVTGLRAAIERLATDPEAGRALGAAGRETVQAEFDARIEAARIARLFCAGPGEDLRPAPLQPEEIS
ncbi:glycosyltransferase family 4 protein [uncultured Roseobacter sp.]|uniref:glycosyltransferase family 4 protein n=1 Tax=uncultured Roseobacter sp. TaxID=114847 RepID=UPI00261A1E8B|nr:glycosyltransferase family 4 protein [uncultured Roseobacter sp.]